MRVLVTGASGFVGQRLVPRLEAAGHLPLAVDREVEISSEPALAAVLRDGAPDAIIHLAALSSPPLSAREPALAYRVNFLGTRALLRAMQRERPSARLIAVGTGDAYPITQPGAPPWTEDAPLAPRSPYARTKVGAEQLCTLAAEDGLDVIRVRAFNHTGAGQAPGFVAPDFASQIAAIAQGELAPAMRVGNLESVRDFLDVDDVVEAYLSMLDPEVPPRVYNVASGRATRIGDLLDALCALAGVTPKIEVDPRRHRPTDACFGDATRLREATGWAPRIELEATLRGLLESFMQGPVGGS